VAEWKSGYKHDFAMQAPLAIVADEKALASSDERQRETKINLKINLRQALGCSLFNGAPH
jgi:hypothetical protein